jgi:hypothetical protein
MMSGPHTSDPPNPLGNDPKPDMAPIAILTVPRIWTRLVIACVTLLFLVVIVVTVMVYLNWRSAQINTQRIIEIERRLGQLEGKVGDKADAH